MTALSRTKHSLKNTVIGLVTFIITQLVSFFSRTVFIKLLGEQFLGINGLYANILSLLSLADLGITSAFTFSLYKPIAQNDNIKLATLLTFFRKLYLLIALIVFIVGISLIPFLKFVVKNSSIDYNDLQFYFFLSVVNVACSYLAVYKSTIFKADQKIYVVNIINSIINFLMYALQIIVLLLSRNYVFYLFVNIICTLLNNIILTILANKVYKEVFQNNSAKLDSADKEEIKKNFASLFVYRLSAAIINSTDNIIISVMLGTVVVGYYSNYSMIISTIVASIGVITNALLGSIGNLGTENNGRRQCEIFHCLMLLYQFVAAFTSACFICVFNQFIIIWLNDSQYLLSQRDVIMIVVSFYITCISNPIWMFRESLGLFKKAQYIMAVAALINIVISIVFGYFLGVGGIILATGISKLLSLFWYEPRYLYRDAFEMPYLLYWKHVCYYTFQSIAVIVLSVVINSTIANGTLFNIILQIAICFIISLIVFCLMNIKTREGKFLLSKLRQSRR